MTNLISINKEIRIGFDITSAVRLWKNDLYASRQGLILENNIDDNPFKRKAFFTTKFTSVPNDRPYYRLLCSLKLNEYASIDELQLLE